MWHMPQTVEKLALRQFKNGLESSCFFSRASTGDSKGVNLKSEISFV